MKLTKCIIRLIDFLETNNKEVFDKEFEKLPITIPSKDQSWENIPLARGRTQSFKFTKIPEGLEFLDSIQINFVQYQNFSSSVMLTIEGSLSTNSFNTIENQDYKENKELLEGYQKKIWDFWKKSITTTVLINNDITIIEPIAINQFRFDVDDYENILDNVLKSKESDEKRKAILKILGKYGTNTIGLISALTITDKEFSILAQNRAVYRMQSFDYTGISFFDFKKSDWESFTGFSLQFHNILALIHFIFWIHARSQQITNWKNKIESLSKLIRQYEKKLSDPYQQKTDLSLFEQKGLFQTDYASFMDEQRYISRNARGQIRLKSDSFMGERIIPTEYISQFSPDDGILTNLSNDILSLTNHLKEEYEVIKEQYKILGEQLTEILNFANVQTNLKFVAESEKSQKSVNRQGNIMIFSTIAVLALTAVLSFFTIQQFFIDNFNPDFEVNDAQIVLISPRGEPQLEYLIPIELSTLTSHHQKFTISVIKDSIKSYNWGNCFFTSPPTLGFSYPSTFFLTSDGDEIKLKPDFRLNYEVNLPYFSPEQLEKSVPYVVGEIKFKITSEDLQNPSVHKDLIATAGLDIRIPSDFDAQQYCKHQQ